MLCDVVRRRRRWAHAPVIHAASHFDHKKRVAWVPISMHTCGSFFYNSGAPLSCAIIIIYTLSDLGVLSNLIGSLSLANEHYSPPTE